MHARVQVTGLLVGLLAVHGVASPQAPPAQPSGVQPTFRASATVVEFTVVATDSQGKPVTDLKQEDLAIAEGGKPRPIAFFRFEGGAGQTPASRSSSETLGPGIFTNRSEYSPGPPRNITAIVIDSLNTRPQDQAVVRAQVLRYLRDLTTDTRVAVYRTGDTVKVVHDFTGNLAALRARIATLSIEEFARPKGDVDVEKVKDAIEQGKTEDVTSGDMLEMLDFGFGEMARVQEYYDQHVQNERSELTLLALEALANHLSGIPGRKNLVWITGGTPSMFAGTRDPWPQSYEPAIRDLARRMASQGITMYPVVASGLTTVDLGTTSVSRGSGFGQGGSQNTTAELHPQAKPAELRLLAGMEKFAEITGGRVAKNTNDLTAGVKAAASDLGGTYSLGFYAAEAADDQWHDVQVKTTRPGVKLLYRQGYLSLAPARQPKDWGAEEWQAAAQNPVGSTAVRFDARAELTGNTLSVVLQMASQDLYFRRNAADQLAAEVDLALAERGALEWSRVRRDQATLSLQNQQANVTSSLIRVRKSWTLNPGTAAVRLLVRDRLTGRYGVLDMNLEGLRVKQ